MKKLLVISLIVGVVSVSGAGLGLTTVGNLDGTVTVGIVSHDTSNWTGWIGIDSVDPDSYTIEAAAGSDAYFIPDPYGYAGYYKLAALDLSPPNDTIVAGTQFTLTYAASVGGVRVNLYDDSYVTIIASTIIFPEPMTIGLLAVGGLFLRRRK